MPSKKPKRGRANEHPARPEPATKVNDRIRAAFQALNGAQYARIEFCNNAAIDHNEQREIAFRNFLSNAASVTFLLQGLRHEDPARWNDWWKPYAEGLNAEPLFRFFYRLRTDSMKRAAPALMWLSPFELPETLNATHMGHDPERGSFVRGTTEDGREVTFWTRPGHWTVKGLPKEYTVHALGLLMQRYLCELERIATETMAEFWTEEVDDGSELRDFFVGDPLGLNDPSEGLD